MFERFTVPAREVVLGAHEEARQMHHRFVGTEHLLLAMLSEDSGIPYAVLHEAGIDADRVRAEVRRLVGTTSPVLDEEDAAALQTIGIDLDAVLSRIEESFGPEALELPPPARRRGLLGRQRDGARLSQRAKKVIELALREAIRLKHHDIGAEHILLGLIREGHGLAAKVLTEAGVGLDDLRRATLARLRDAA